MIRSIVTGCDRNTEWQLPWFIGNYFKHNDTRLLVADFGMSKEMRARTESIDNVEVFSFESKGKGWFKKPRALLQATVIVEVACWLDTDCEVRGNLEGIFKHYVPGTLGMVEDRPWTVRRGTHGPWYNSGVVLSDHNRNLSAWATQCEVNPVQGDQEVLYGMIAAMSDIEKLGWINPLPHKYNTLRLDYIDKIAVKDPLIVHHTGQKGKEVIREQMSNDQ